MIRTKNTIGIFFLLLTMVACNSETPTFDTSSKETKKQSIQMMAATMKPDERMRLQKVLAGIYTIGALASLGGKQSEEEIFSLIDSKLNGKTAVEIFTFANELKRRLKSDK